MRRTSGILLALLFAAAAAFAASRQPAAAGDGRADLRVKGLGYFADHHLRKILLLLLGNERGRTMSASAIEDAALIVFSNLNDQGFLQAGVTVEVADRSGRIARYALDPRLARPLPRDIAGRIVTFHVRRGRRFILSQIRFEGLTAMRPDQARTYFRGEGLLASLTAEQAYSPSRLQRSASNFTQELEARGFFEAKVRIGEVRIDFDRGRVAVDILVDQGPVWIVRRVSFRVAGGGPVPAGIKERLGEPWTTDWQHAAEKDVFAWYYERGYPDVQLKLTPTAAPPVGLERAVTVVAEIVTGEQVRLGKIRFVGAPRVRRGILRPLVRARSGALLDPQKLEDGQVRISRLGSFRSVDLDYEPPKGPLRDAVYKLEEGKRQEVSLMAGWGSYEELRGGVEWRDYDLFHAGTQGTLKLTQSMKSSEGEYDYVVPELFGTSADATAKLFGFLRKDRSFWDEEYGLSLSAVSPLTRLGADLTAGYSFVRLRVPPGTDTLGTYLTDRLQANATSVEATLTRDRRDNPLVPRHGYKVSLELEEASRWLGGQVDFQEVQFNASYHTPWGHSRWIHAGLNESFITTLGAPAQNQLPPNVLFYPGGEDSIRGYGYGQAAPRDANGNLVGAKSMTLLNLELEQALTSKFSVVGFSDSLAIPGGRLFSLGLGLRFQTFVGPIRLEYGRNLNPRRGDPEGTLQFSVGFPF